MKHSIKRGWHIRVCWPFPFVVSSKFNQIIVLIKKPAGISRQASSVLIVGFNQSLTWNTLDPAVPLHESTTCFSASSHAESVTLICK